MPDRTAEQMRQAALKCTRLSRNCADRAIAIELETVAIELTEMARELDRMLEQA